MSRSNKEARGVKQARLDMANLDASKGRAAVDYHNPGSKTYHQGEDPVKKKKKKKAYSKGIGKGEGSVSTRVQKRSKQAEDYYNDI